MRVQTRYPLASLCTAVLLLFGVFFAANRAQAQCPNVTICNYAPCPVSLCLYDAFGLVWCSPVVAANFGPVPPLPPFPPFPPPPPAGCGAFFTVLGFNPVGVVSMAPLRYPWAPTGFATPSRVVRNVTLGPAPGCCVDVYFDPATCTLWIYPSIAPPPCNP